MPSSEPVMPPSTSEPSTISIGALSPDRVGTGRVADAVAAERGDEQRDQAEAVGDDVPGALAQPVSDQHADARCRSAPWSC